MQELSQESRGLCWDCARKPMHFPLIQTPRVPHAAEGIGLIPAKVIVYTIQTIWLQGLPISFSQDLLYHHQSAVPQRMLRRQYRESKPLGRLNLVR